MVMSISGSRKEKQKWCRDLFGAAGEAERRTVPDRGKEGEREKKLAYSAPGVIARLRDEDERVLLGIPEMNKLAQSSR
jgi:hypothetical protein